MKPTRESDGAPTPRTKLNGSSRCAIYANRSSKHVSYTHTDQELQINSYLILSNTLPRPASSSVRLLLGLVRRRPPRRRRFVCRRHEAEHIHMRGESGKGDVDGHRFDVDRHHFLRYHLLGMLCWLYPVGCPRIIQIIIIIIISICTCAACLMFHVHVVVGCYYTIIFLTPYNKLLQKTSPLSQSYPPAVIS